MWIKVFVEALPDTAASQPYYMVANRTSYDKSEFLSEDNAYERLEQHLGVEPH